MQSGSASRRILLSIGIALLSATPAMAHVPYLEETDYSVERPYVVRDVANSKSIHAQIREPGDVDVYRIDVDRPTRIYTQTDIPGCPQYQDFGVTYALAGPGLPPPATPLPVSLPPGYGAIVVRDAAPPSRELWVEPFSGRQMWLGPHFALPDAPPGSYQMIVWNEQGRTGDYIAVIGEAEIFDEPEIRQVMATSPKLRNGANLMVPCDPTVTPPAAPRFGASSPETGR